jgi:mycothiol synthase
VSDVARPFEVVRQLDPKARTALQVLAQTVLAADGHAPLDQRRLEQALTGDAPEFLAALAWDDAQSALIGYVQAVRSFGGWDIESVIAASLTPQARHEMAARLIPAVIDAAGAEDDTDVRLWAYRATERDDRLAANLGLVVARELRQMRRALPLEEPWRRLSAELVTRPFKVDHDEAAWLDANRRAFAEHPEQGTWTLADLRARQREPWFDPDGFLLHQIDGKLAGFCWTKVHTDVRPPMGEIYVIGVHPDHQQEGLGRALLLAGLAHLTTRGLTVGMLYVDASNRPAVSLYESLGFTVHHVDRMYRLSATVA